jgi:hypothetical protein
MFRRGRPASEFEESAALRRERATIEKLRREVGDRLAEAKKREAALEKRLRLEQDGPGKAERELVEGLEERSLELDRRERELRYREAALAGREEGLAQREAVVDAPEILAQQLAELEQRKSELVAAEQLFARTRQELVDRGEAIAAKEEEIRLRQRVLTEAGAPPISLPPLDDDVSLVPIVKEPGAFSLGLRELERRGARRRRRR